jgi:Trk-type K+ transport system membrane component
MLMYWVVVFRPRRMLGDVEWCTYVSVILVATVLVIAFGLYFHDFGPHSGMVAPADCPNLREVGDCPNFREAKMGLSPSEPQPANSREAKTGPSASQPAFATAARYGLFQVVSIMTTTGFCTDNFDTWNSFGRGALLLLMFVGGCAGSTGGGLKVIRHILFVKILRLEVEQAFHPTVVRPLWIAGRPVEDPDLRKNILVYFALIVSIFAAGWLFTITVEPNSTWTDHGHAEEHKLIDAAGCIAATLNNIGPGLGVIGATKNYTNFTWPTKILFIWLMMLGRLEIFVILVLFAPAFWRTP